MAENELRFVEQGGNGNKISKIRELNLADLSIILPRFNTPEIVPHLSAVPSLISLKEDWNNPNCHIFVAINSQNDILGTFKLRVEEDDKKIVNLERFVAFEQGNGIGGEMLNFAIAIAFQELDCDEIRLKVGRGVPNDEKIVKFYEGRRFQIIATEKNTKHLNLFFSNLTIDQRNEFIYAGCTVVEDENGFWVTNTADKTIMALTRETWKTNQTSRRRIIRLK